MHTVASACSYREIARCIRKQMHRECRRGGKESAAAGERIGRRMCYVSIHGRFETSGIWAGHNQNSVQFTSRQMCAVVAKNCNLQVIKY